MGAGIAAGPHCPFASGAAEAGPSRWAVSRRGNRDKSRPRILRSPSEPKPSRCPRWLPDGAEALTVRRSADLELASRFLALAIAGAEAPVTASGRILGRSLGSAWQVMRRNAGSRLVRSSRAETRSCPTPPKPKLLLSRWQRACPKTSLSAGLVLDPKIRCPAWPVPILPEGLPGTGWALFEACRSRIR